MFYRQDFKLQQNIFILCPEVWGNNLFWCIPTLRTQPKSLVPLLWSRENTPFTLWLKDNYLAFMERIFAAKRTWLLAMSGKSLAKQHWRKWGKKGTHSGSYPIQRTASRANVSGDGLKKEYPLTFFTIFVSTYKGACTKKNIDKYTENDTLIVS